MFRDPPSLMVSSSLPSREVRQTHLAGSANVTLARYHPLGLVEALYPNKHKYVSMKGGRSAACFSKVNGESLSLKDLFVDCAVDQCLVKT